ncbi:DUF5133 domain-containing protein [Streptomyces sp. CWNU-52B]|uniref:DUF5133 domain-containing protein n=1 Tax=unclassified Streptomyces TaxID=2593676 RepID=UPI0039BF87B2
MMVPAEKELRTILSRFAETRIEHDVRPTDRTARALADVTYTLCVMTASRTAEQALRAADLLLEQYRSSRDGVAREDETLAA